MTGRIPTLADLGDVRGKRVLVRTDFNVPMDGDVITDDLRIRAALPTINWLVERGATVVTASHLGRPKGAPDPKYSMDAVRARLAERLGAFPVVNGNRVELLDDYDAAVDRLVADVDAARGLDHGAWIPLSLVYPGADVPVLQVSIDSEQTPAHHFALGRALRPLRDDGVLVLGSGGVTHNLRMYFGAAQGRHDDPPLEWVEAFNEWTAGAVLARRFDDLLHYVGRAPYAAQNHPTPEHFLPLFVTLGAAHDDEPYALQRDAQVRGALAPAAQRSFDVGVRDHHVDEVVGERLAERGDHVAIARCVLLHLCDRVGAHEVVGAHDAALGVKLSPEASHGQKRFQGPTSSASGPRHRGGRPRGSSGPVRSARS